MFRCLRHLSDHSYPVSLSWFYGHISSKILIWEGMRTCDCAAVCLFELHFMPPWRPLPEVGFPRYSLIIWSTITVGIIMVIDIKTDKFTHSVPVLSLWGFPFLHIYSSQTSFIYISEICLYNLENYFVIKLKQPVFNLLTGTTQPRHPSISPLREGCTKKKPEKVWSCGQMKFICFWSGSKRKIRFGH